MNAPRKTPAGLDELRHRTHRLSQRHRTVLLLVDGQRSVAEVLDLAHKAGAQASHLDALVQLGMVEMPPAPAPGVVSASAEEATQAAPAAQADTMPADPEPAAVADQVAEPPQVTLLNPHPVDAAAPPAGDEPMLDEVRRLLIDTLRRDSLLLRAFAPARVRTARTQDALIALVWEIERERAHDRRKRGQLLKLQRARELLGMGNTQVAGDSLPAPPSLP